MKNILLKGSSSLDIGVLDGLTHHDFELEFFPLLSGFWKLGGLVISDKISGQILELDELTSIRVLP